MDFNYAGELLKLCEETKLPISEVMKRREMDFSSMTAQEVERKDEKVAGNYEDGGKRAFGK